MSSQDKLRGKAQRKSAFVDIFSWIVYHFLYNGDREVCRWMKIFCCSECLFFLHNSRITSYGSSFLCNFEDLLLLLTLKLSAVILAPAGTVYMLLGDKGNDGDNSIVTKLITRRVHIARRLVAKISPHHALPNRSPVGIPRGGRHHCFSWILHRGQVPDADLIFFTVLFLR